MERKPNESDIKQGLISRLAEITTSSNGENSVVLSNDQETYIDISLNYGSSKFRFKPGQFIQLKYGFPGNYKEAIGLVVGVGKWDPRTEDEDELWFLFEQNPGISYFRNTNNLCFIEKEIRDELIIL